MKLKSFLSLAFGLLVLGSCNSKNRPTVKSNDIDICKKIASGTTAIIPDGNEYNAKINVNVKSKRIINTSELIDVDSSHLIFLETNENNLVGSIDKLMIWGDKIIIVDKRIVNGFFVFNSKGEFIKKVNSVGRGFAEYNHITDITINKKDGLIVLYDHTSKKALLFTSEGDFVNEKKVNDYYKNIAFFSENKYLGYSDYSLATGNNKHHSLSLLDSNFNKIEEFLEIPNGLKVISPASLYEGQNGLFLVSSYYNNIALFKGNKMYPFADIKVKNGSEIDYAFLEGITNLPADNQLKALQKTDQINSLMNLQVNTSKVLFTYACKDARNSVLFDLNTKKSISCNGLFSDDLFMNNIVCWPLASFDNNWVFPLYPGPIVTGYTRSLLANSKEGVSKDVFDGSLNKHNKLLYKITQHSKENDNPVLLVARVKPL
jgi:hypothetical protein